jgi:hypothetical protein
LLIKFSVAVREVESHGVMCLNRKNNNRISGLCSFIVPLLFVAHHLLKYHPPFVIVVDVNPEKVLSIL